MKFVKFDTRRGPMWINPSTVKYIHKYENPIRLMTEITFVDGDYIIVEHSVETVLGCLTCQ